MKTRLWEDFATAVSKVKPVSGTSVQGPTAGQTPVARPMTQQELDVIRNKFAELASVIPGVQNIVVPTGKEWVGVYIKSEKIQVQYRRKTIWADKLQTEPSIISTRLSREMAQLGYNIAMTDSPKPYIGYGGAKYKGQTTMFAYDKPVMVFTFSRFKP